MRRTQNPYSMKIKCIIIDDEPLAVRVIKNYLEEIQNFELIEVFNNPIQALPTIEKGEIDLLFLDINMPKMNGLEFLRSLTNKPHTIITTAYREFAVESFDLDVIDYLVKPIPLGRFLKATNKITNRMNLERGNTAEPSTLEEPFIFLKPCGRV